MLRDGLTVSKPIVPFAAQAGEAVLPDPDVRVRLDFLRVDQVHDVATGYL